MPWAVSAGVKGHWQDLMEVNNDVPKNMDTKYEHCSLSKPKFTEKDSF